jgi:tRNA-Thr(GGU) m(6)t(6)A37 methyltransferase TsaA
MKPTLWIDSRAGLSGDRLVAALIGLGAPEQEMMRVLQSAAEELGMVDAHTHIEFLPDETLAHRLHLILLQPHEPSPSEAIPAALESALSRTGVRGVYADFTQRVLAILRATEGHIASAIHLAPEEAVSLPIIGTAHTPYKHKAPYQPMPENVSDGAFYIQLAPQYAAGTQALETFSHIFVLSYLDRSLEPEITVRPPWKNGPERYGTFATRSPNRPSPIGLTRVRLLRVEGNCIYTSPLDLFDDTPILDIKPFIRSLDGNTDDLDAGNDGWLEGSNHLELHRLMIPHTHPGETRNLYEPSILIAVLTGIGWGLQRLGVDLSSVACSSPVNTGAEHALEPAARAILEEHNILFQAGSDIGALLTPDGAAILAALTPTFIEHAEIPSDSKRAGLGLGQQNLDAAPSFGALRLFIN